MISDVIYRPPCLLVKHVREDLVQGVADILDLELLIQ